MYPPPSSESSPISTDCLEPFTIACIWVACPQPARRGGPLLAWACEWVMPPHAQPKTGLGMPPGAGLHPIVNGSGFLGRDRVWAPALPIFVRARVSGEVGRVRPVSLFLAV